MPLPRAWTLPLGSLVAAIVAAPACAAQCAHPWQPLGPGLGSLGSSVVASATLPDNSVVAYANGLLGSFMRWDGTAWWPFGVGLDAGVWTLVRLANGDLLVGGSFRNIGGIAANRIARWNGTTWTTLGSGIDQSIVSRVNAIVEMPNGDIVIGGWFSMAGGVSAEKIARWNGSTWSALGSGMDSNVYALTALSNGDLVAGGNFTLAGGTPVSGIALWNGTSWSAMGGGVNGVVAALATLPGDRVLAGGRFTTAGGVSANRIALWNGSTWSALTSGVDDGVNTIVARSVGDVIVGGVFTRAGGNPASLVARWDGAHWSPVGSGLDRGAHFGTEMVQSLAIMNNGDFVAGGSFTTASGFPRNRIARFGAGCPASVASYGSSCTGSAGPMLLAATGLPVIGYTFPMAASGFASGALGVRMLGSTSAAVPLRSVHPAGQIGCDLALVPDILFEVATPSAGSLSFGVPLPNEPSLVAAVAHAQVASIELSGPNISLITATNGFRFVLGTF